MRAVVCDQYATLLPVIVRAFGAEHHPETLVDRVNLVFWAGGG